MTDTLQDDERSIMEALRDAKIVDVPSELKEGTVIQDDTLDLGDERMTVIELKNAGYIYVWDTRTHKIAPILRYMLPEVMRRRRPDGSYIWTDKDPKKLPQRGTLKCLLHKDSPNRKEYDRMGLRTCKKSNITNDFEVKQHMSKKHPKEWQALEDQRKERERQEDREFQRTLYEAIGKKEEKAPLYVSDKDKAKIK